MIWSNYTQTTLFHLCRKSVRSNYGTNAYLSFL